MRVCSLGERWVLGNGRRVNLWTDNWYDGPKLREVVQGPLHQGVELLRVADVLTTDGTWNWEKMQMKIPDDIKGKLLGAPRSILTQSEDYRVWWVGSNGRFSTRSAYNLLRRNSEQEAGKDWSWIWKIKAHPRIFFFIWQLCHGKIPTTGLLNDMGMNVDPMCRSCKQRMEDIVHLLQECPYAVNFWQKLKIPISKLATFNLHIKDWLKINVMSYEKHTSNLEWAVIFPYAIRSLWKRRNGLLFDGDEQIEWEKARINGAAEYQALCLKSGTSAGKETVEIKWN